MKTVLALVFGIITLIWMFNKFTDVILEIVDEKLDTSYADQSKLKKVKDCRACLKYRTMDCPNSSMCLATEEKPYFVSGCE